MGKLSRKIKNFLFYPLLASALSFTPLNIFSQSNEKDKESEWKEFKQEIVAPIKEKNELVNSPDATTSFYGDVALNAFKQPNYKTHGAFTLNYYGSGDVNNDNVIDWTDYNTILSNPSDRTDINGDGVTNSTDKSILLEYLTDATQRPYLPAHWNLLQNRPERISWLQKAIAIDQTQVPKSGWSCYDYSKQFFINLCGVENIAGSGLNFNKIDTTKNARFNIPTYEVYTQTNTNVAHSINSVITGDSISTFNNGWYFIEPQNDTRVFPGNVSMGANSFADIRRFSYYYHQLSGQYIWGLLNLVNFDLQAGQVISTTINPSPETILYRTLATVHLQGTKPVDAVVNWQNGTVNTEPSVTGYPTNVSPSGTQTLWADSTNQASGNWNPAHYNYDIKRNWKLQDPNNSLVDTTLAHSWTIYNRPAQNIHVQDTAKPVFTSTPGNMTLYYTQRDNIPVAQGNDNSGFWNIVRTITSNQGTNSSNCDYYEFLKTVKDSIYDPSNNNRVAISLVNIVLDPTNFTYVPPEWTVNYGQPLDPSNTGGSATATNPAGVAVNISYVDNSDQNSDTTQCEHYNYDLNRTWWAVTQPCQDSISASQLINVQEIQPPNWTYFPPEATVPIGGSIHPDYTGWPEGEDPISGMPILKNWYDSVTNQTPNWVYIDRHWSLEDICQTETNDSIQQINQELVEGINQNNSEKDVLQVYPNPTSNYVNFVYNSKKSEKVNLKINDLTGRKLEEIVVQANSGENKTRMDFSGYPTGVYIVTYTSSESTESEKLIKIE